MQFWCSIEIHFVLNVLAGFPALKEQIPGASPDMSAGCSNDPGQQTMILLISGIHTAEGGIRGSRPSREGTEDMIRAPSPHRLSWIGIEKVKNGQKGPFSKDQGFPSPSLITVRADKESLTHQ